MPYKRREKKALELAAKNKQMTFGEPSLPFPSKNIKKGRSQTTYWRCKNGHIFRQRIKVHESRIPLLKCSECGASVSDQVPENIYMDYLHDEGRVHEKEYRKSINKLQTKK